MTKNKKSPRNGRRSPRGVWTPLKYPKSALVGTEDDHHLHYRHRHVALESDANSERKWNVYFPFSRPVLLACIRELLILDQTLDSSTWTVLPKTCRYMMSSKTIAESIRPEKVDPSSASSDIKEMAYQVGFTYQHHIDPQSWIRDEESSTKKHRKRTQSKKSNGDGLIPKKRRKDKTKPLEVAQSTIQVFKQEQDETLIAVVDRMEPPLSVNPSKVFVMSDDTPNRPIPTESNRREANVERTTTMTVTLPSAQELATIILLRARILPMLMTERHQPPIPEYSFSSSLANHNHNIHHDHDHLDRPPRKVSVSEYETTESTITNNKNDQPSPSPSLSVVLLQEDDQEEVVVEEGEEESQDISLFVNLSERMADGSYARKHTKETDMPDLLQVSIADEALLREAALVMTNQMLVSFSNDALRLFLGYKTPVMARDRMIAILAGYLLDVSHAMFAWEHTEQEYREKEQIRTNAMTSNNNSNALDATIQESLFDERALERIGGMESSSLLPHAISIARLERLSSTTNSWETFATTPEGKRLLGHHQKGLDHVCEVGRRRRGQRLRQQRHWLIQATAKQEQDPDPLRPPGSTTTLINQRSRACSLGSSSDEDLLETRHRSSDHRFSSKDATMSSSLTEEQPTHLLLTDLPSNTMSLTLLKASPSMSWGVGLVKEGSMCVVGRVSNNHKSNSTNVLQCGDLILRVENERGQEAYSPVYSMASSSLSSSSSFGAQVISPVEDDESWFRTMVDLFKSSQSLHIIIQRVGGPNYR